MEYKQQTPESFNKAVEYVRQFNSVEKYGDTAFVETGLTVEGTVSVYKAVNPFGRVITVIYMAGAHKLIVSEDNINLSDPDRMAQLMLMKINKRSCTNHRDKMAEMDGIVKYLTRLCYVWNNKPTSINKSVFVDFCQECSDNGWYETNVERKFIVKEDLEQAIADERTVEHVLDFLCKAGTDSVRDFLNEQSTALDLGWDKIAIYKLTPEYCGRLVCEGVSLGFNIKIGIKNHDDKFIVGFFNDNKKTLEIVSLSGDSATWRIFFQTAAEKIVEKYELYKVFKTFEKEYLAKS